MDELIRLHKALTNLIQNWDSLIKQFILDFEPLFVDTVTDQLSKGKGGDGNNLESYASDEYAKFKKSIGSISSPIADLNLSGDFYSGMTMNDSFEIFSTDWKDSVLHQMFGEDITEISEANLSNIIKEQILPEFEAFIKTKLGI